MVVISISSVRCAEDLELNFGGKGVMWRKMTDICQNREIPSLAFLALAEEWPKTLDFKIFRTEAAVFRREEKLHEFCFLSS